MIARRDLLIGAACASSVVLSNALRPHRFVTLLQGKLADIVPKAFGDWGSQDIGDPLAVNGPGTLSAQLYNEILGRSYTNAKTRSQVTILLAYGKRQSDDLQLHRPEVCYPAFGYTLTRNEPLQIPIDRQVSVPARRLVAEADDRRENIVYWTRLGERLPQDGGDQRKARFENAIEGIIPDGILCRFSNSGDYPELRWRELDMFVAELVTAIPAASRRVLIGTSRANILASEITSHPTNGSGR